jgi:hypothetical protein
MVGPARDPFDSTVSAKELPVTAALGYVDVMDIYPWGPVSLEMWYRLLNCGFRIAPGAGTDTFTNWRSINQVPGNARVMVRSQEALTYPAWIEGLRKGRSFVTNGPMLHVRANGKEPGDVLRSGPGQSLLLELSIDVESLVPLDRIEVIINGRIAGEHAANQQRRLQWSWRHRQNESGWLAVRVRGEPSPRSLGSSAQAHSAPVYLEPGGVPMRPDRDDARFFVTWIDRLADLLELRNNFEKPEHKRRVRDLMNRARAFYAAAER